MKTRTAYLPILCSCTTERASLTPLPVFHSLALLTLSSCLQTEQAVGLRPIFKKIVCEQVVDLRPIFKKILSLSKRRLLPFRKLIGPTDCVENPIQFASSTRDMFRVFPLGLSTGRVRAGIHYSGSGPELLCRIQTRPVYPMGPLFYVPGLPEQIYQIL